MTTYMVTKKIGTLEEFVFKTIDKNKAYSIAEKLSNKGYICIIRRY